LKEAEFAFKQSFAYCPYSEGSSKYAQLLLETGRAEDALRVVSTFQKMDPYNRQGQNMEVQLLLNLGKLKEALSAAKDFLRLEPNNPDLQKLVDQLEKNQSQQSSVPLDAIFNQIASELKANQTNQATELLQQVMMIPQANGMILTKVAEDFAAMRNFAKAEEAMRRATQIEPNASQTWYNLANIQAFQGHAAEAAESIKKAFAANALELAGNPNMIDLRAHARTNAYFDGIRKTPEFRAAVGAN
jgi:predicted Zn-dependent protease